MIQTDQLLFAVSPQNACGEDISYDPAFLDLETALLGKPETQFSEAEPPDWKKIVRTSEDLLGRSKHLRVALALTAGLIRTDGLAGFHNGLSLIHGLIERYWEPLYPRLDPEDNNDPTERMNIVGALTAPAGTIGDPYAFLEAIRKAPLTQSVQLGRFSLEDIAAAAAPTPENEVDQKGHARPNQQLIDAAFQDTPPEVLKAAYDTAKTSLSQVQQLFDLISEKAGLGAAPDFDPLKSVLREAIRTLEPRLAAGDAAVPEAAAIEAGPAGASAAPSAARSAPGTIGSREDVVRALDLICAYYQRCEPSSPVPLLLERAKRLTTMDFLAVMEDLNPDALDSIHRIVGIRPN